MGLAEGGGKRGAWRISRGLGAEGWSDPGQGRAEPVRVREGVWQGPSRQQTRHKLRMAEQKDRRGVMVTFWGHTSYTSPVLPFLLFSYTEEENLGSLNHQCWGDSVICSLT